MKKEDWLGTFGQKEQHDGEFPEFSLYAMYPMLGFDEVANLELLVVWEKKSSKIQLSLAKGLERGESRKTENF